MFVCLLDHHCVCKRNCRIRSIFHKTILADSVACRNRRHRTCMCHDRCKSRWFDYRVCNRLSRSICQHRNYFPRTHIAFHKNRHYRNICHTWMFLYPCILLRSAYIPVEWWLKFNTKNVIRYYTNLIAHTNI